MFASPDTFTVNVACSYPFFASHKKSHTRFGDASADLARATKVSQSYSHSKIIVPQKDIIKYKANLEGYFDAGKIGQATIYRRCLILFHLSWFGIC